MIRISGDDALTVADKVFRAASGEKLSELPGYVCRYGRIFDGERELDDGIASVFLAPHSFTGENVAEITCHGGIYITERVLLAVYSAGARPAAAGEFTKRAFLNGKMSLTQAEAVMDIISAQGEQFMRCAHEAKEGAVFRRIKGISERLTKLLGDLAAWVDYPEEDIPIVTESDIELSLGDILSEISRAKESFYQGRILRDGVETAIIGRPNVGKSTLMNLLSGFERSIVTDIAGTTRDVVEETVRVGNVILRLSDTAGIRTADNVVEEVGVRLAEKKLSESSLILAVFDSSCPLSEEDIEITEKLRGRNVVAVINKSDLAARLDIEFIKKNFEHFVYISAKTGEGAEQLTAAVEDIFKTAGLEPAAGIIANERQRVCLERAETAAFEALGAVKSGLTFDAVTVLLDDAAAALYELTGERVTEAVVDEVFSRFCVGK